MNDIQLTQQEEAFARKLLPSSLIAAAILMSAKTGKLIREPEEIVVRLAHRLSRDAARTERTTSAAEVPHSGSEGVKSEEDEVPPDFATLATLPPVSQGSHQLGHSSNPAPEAVNSPLGRN